MRINFYIYHCKSNKMSESFEIIINGIVDGKKITPNDIDITLLKDYISDINTLLKKNEKDISDENIYVKVEDGSLKIAVLSVALLINSSFTNDIIALKNTGILNEISPKRAEILGKWQKKAKTNNSLTFNIIQNGESILQIDKQSEFKNDFSKFVEIEQILYGTITDLGGKNNPNIHLDTENGSITIYCKKEDLINQDNKLYRYTAIRTKVKQHISTLELDGKYQFIEFLPYKGPLTGNELDNFINKHSKYWENIPDSAEWQRKLRDENDF